MFEDDSAYCAEDHIGMSKEDEMVMQMWETQTVCKTTVVIRPIPYKNVTKATNNKFVAEHRLRSLRHHLMKDTELAKKYTCGIEDLLRKGHAEKVIRPILYKNITKATNNKFVAERRLKSLRHCLMKDTDKRLLSWREWKKELHLIASSNVDQPKHQACWIRYCEGM